MVILTFSYSASAAEMYSDELMIDTFMDIATEEANEASKDNAISEPPKDNEDTSPKNEGIEQDFDQISSSIANNLENILSKTNTKEKTKNEITDQLKELVSAALLAGTDMNELRSVVKIAMENMDEPADSYNKDEHNSKFKEASKTLVNLVKRRNHKSRNKTSSSDGELINQKELPKTATVERGESLYTLAIRIYGSSDNYLKLYEANKDTMLDPNVLIIGQVLHIPN